MVRLGLHTEETNSAVYGVQRIVYDIERLFHRNYLLK